MNHENYLESRESSVKRRVDSKNHSESGELLREITAILQILNDSPDSNDSLNQTMISRIIHTS